MAVKTVFSRAVSALILLACMVVGQEVMALGETGERFSKWEERVLHQCGPTARSDPQLEMTAWCGLRGGGVLCAHRAADRQHQPVLPGRFHSDEMLQQSYFNHPRRAPW